MVKSSQVFKALFKNTPKTLDVGRETSIRNFAKDPFQKINILETPMDTYFHSDPNLYTIRGFL